MLAEIYFLRLESLVRASEGAARAQNPRFNPTLSKTFRRRCPDRSVRAPRNAGHASRLTDGPEMLVRSPQ